MAQRFYRNYYSWLLAAEPRLGVSMTPARKLRQAMGLGLVIFFFAAFLIWQRMQVVKIGYDVVELAKTRDQLLVANAKLRREMRQLHSLEHAENIARTRLGMVNLDARRVVYADDPAAHSPGLIKRAWQRLRRWW